MKKYSFLPVLLIAIIAFVSSCHKSDQAVYTMIGTWNKSVNGVAYKLYIPDSTHFSYDATINGAPFIASGIYTGINGQVSFKETSGSSYCPNVLGTYTFSATTTTLTLTASTDPCLGGYASRSTIFTGDWTK